MKNITSFSIISLLIFTFAACNKDEKNVSPVISNEGLTTVQLELQNTSENADKPFAQWEQLLDINGNPQDPDYTKDTLRLKANSVYTAQLNMLDKSQEPVFDATTEIRERSNYHLFFYQPLATTSPLVIPNNYPTDLSDVYPDQIPTPIPDQAPLKLTVAITDHDTSSPSLPLGLATKFTTGTASSGWLRIVLRHQPDQKNGTYAPGSTDLDVGFAVIIE